MDIRLIIRRIKETPDNLFREKKENNDSNTPLQKRQNLIVNSLKCFGVQKNEINKLLLQDRMNLKNLRK